MTNEPPEDGDAARDTSPEPGSGDAGSGLQRAVAGALERLATQPLAAGLHVVATPIGNLADVTLRALSVLARVDLILCEDTRHSQRLLQHYGIRRPLVPYHEHNAERERPRVLQRLGAGGRIALISDAGTPLISDPGYKLIREAREAGYPVWPLPGPSAPIAALSVAGLPTDRFTFAGFLPPKSAARRTSIEALRDLSGTLALFEAPQRLAETLADLADVLGDREGAVARELTKLHEEVRRGPLTELAEWARQASPRGEIVILVAPAAEQAVPDAEILRHLDEAMRTLSLRDASRAVADRLGVPRNHAYRLALGRRADGG